ncbi:IS110 family transposase [Enterococcus sp. BWB1-3]|uniref:IS110 family transposase n=1 Tax=Enterococcus sp. BWB1-3 TaxID=2787713 RepID=UPI001920D665|nr:IS110 family transposase [Enterococcus sp. BWB1-3]MBL1230387.1 IS110 family transposase [Enterococcus sp. BWB1-3]
MDRTQYLYVGMDIHKETHTAVLLNYLEEKQGEITITNTLQGFHKLENYVLKQKGKLIPIFGLEDVTHYGRNLSIFLLDKGYPVKEVNPSLSFMERMSYASTKKNDSWDAQCISAVLMRRSHLLPDANPQDYYWTMRHIVNRRNALVKSLGGLTRQFHEQLQVAYPSYKQFFHELTCATSLAFYERFPSPKHLEYVSEEELGTFLRVPSHNTCSTNRARKILDLVAQEQQTTLDYQQERDCLVRSIAQQIRFILREISSIEKLEKQMYRQLGYQLETIPGVNIVTACSLVAHIGDIHRFSSPHKLANYAGVAPLHFGSAGKGKDVQNKSQGNRNLYSTLYFLAIQQIYLTNKGEPRNPVYRAYFEKKISEGKTKIQALICIMRKLIRIIYVMMKKKVAYELPELKQKAVS